MSNGNETQPPKKPEDEDPLDQLRRTGEIDEIPEGAHESLNVDMASLSQPVFDDPPVDDPPVFDDIPIDDPPVNDPPISDPEIPDEPASLLGSFPQAHETVAAVIQLILWALLIILYLESAGRTTQLSPTPTRPRGPQPG